MSSIADSQKKRLSKREKEWYIFKWISDDYLYRTGHRAWDKK